jgi:hypothetical protein
MIIRSAIVVFPARSIETTSSALASSRLVRMTWDSRSGSVAFGAGLSALRVAFE